MPKQFLPLPTPHELKTQDLILLRSELVNLPQPYNPNNLASTLVSPSINGYRQALQSNLKAVQHAITPLVEKHGIGLVAIVCGQEMDRTEYRYLPQNLCDKLVKEAFSKGSGEMLWLIIEQTLHLFNWPTVVPVLAMSTADEIPSFFFLQDFRVTVNKRSQKSEFRSQENSKRAVNRVLRMGQKNSF